MKKVMQVEKKLETRVSELEEQVFKPKQSKKEKSSHGKVVIYIILISEKIWKVVKSIFLDSDL
tara:strand:- start:1146 stop:1334 length:189 start_codon:yes stop_codon:yes gene_type:complete